MEVYGCAYCYYYMFFFLWWFASSFFWIRISWEAWLSSWFQVNLLLPLIIPAFYTLLPEQDLRYWCTTDLLKKMLFFFSPNPIFILPPKLLCYACYWAQSLYALFPAVKDIGLWINLSLGGEHRNIISWLASYHLAVLCRSACEDIDLTLKLRSSWKQVLSSTFK